MLKGSDRWYIMFAAMLGAGMARADITLVMTAAILYGAFSLLCAWLERPETEDR